MFSMTNARVIFGATAILFGSLILSSCGGGGRGPDVGVLDVGMPEVAPSVISTIRHRDNASAQDLRDHWNDPAPAQAALGLSAVSPADMADRKATLSTLLAGAGNDADAGGTLMRNIRPQQLEVIGERDGITFGQWTGGPAGTLNIEFDFQFAPTLDPHFRALMERAGKAWSYRLADDFPPRVIEAGAGPTPESVYPRDTIADDILVTVIRVDQLASGGGWWRVEETDTDFEPYGELFALGWAVLTQGDVWAAHIMAHEIGHALGHGFGGELPPTKARYVDRERHVFTGPAAMRANGGQPVPFQWLDARRSAVPPGTPGAEIDYAHIGIVDTLIGYGGPEILTPHEIDFAVLDDIGYDVLPASVTDDPELYGYGAWGRYSAWGAGVERDLDVDAFSDRLGAAADAFGLAPQTTLAEANAGVTGRAVWSGALLGVDIGSAKLPPVFGDAELGVDLETFEGTAAFDNLTVAADGARRAFRAPRLQYGITIAGSSFVDDEGRLAGRFFGPNHEEMAGVLHDGAADVNLLAGFGGVRR